MKALIVNNHSKFVQNIVNILDEFSVFSEVIDYDKFEFTKKIESDFDFFILSGGDIPITTNNLLDQERELIKKTIKPLFGICCGFEVISLLHGVELVDLPKKIKGVTKIQIIDPVQLNQITEFNELEVFESHDCAIQKTPHNFVVLAKSKTGIEIIKHKTRPIMATQFHPEVLENNNGKIILEEFIKNIIAM
ncbi:C26 family cysteine hydrolase domain-containing family [Candidatus Woesearchaeota archaeon]|jgi:GMP synthase-like glutamine amidotransferase|nr:C26 family cysteine hydrolase domain-containing family [Candidatus Woesearchaeota archaeon]MBT6518472.1 C26 family cysteine hydrolase domain-containing family [Candidatus Woesearchaeota archaeon]MBT7366984.1 C26 family cysteine hydrolase domain-containing family [Candidatus Woesearchaeota archaeon]